MDKYTVETRKKVLETYLKGLIDKPDICNGPELKEFLGYEGDGRIAFVRKPSDVGARRIDQMLVRTVSGVFDKIVERLPSLPQELPSFSGKKEESKEDDNMPSDDVDSIDIDFSISERQTQSELLSLEHILERFTQLKGQKSLTACEEGDITLEKSCTNADIKETVTDPKDGYRSGTPDTETKTSEAELTLANHVLDILVEILSSHDNWVCRERVQTAARLVLGKALNRWLEEKVDFLVSTEMVQFYLTTLQKTFWPEGDFVLEPRLKLTPQQEERIKFQAVNCLINFFPGTLVKLIGPDDFEIAIEETLECLTHKTLNRHLWYCVIDLLIEKLFPEITMDDVHRSALEKRRNSKCTAATLSTENTLEKS
ncbi:hypothetical protein ACJMK2_004101 [Sinanodonta woodiana]|uniref:Sorting nexin C-terminal domain-containing protein n=1 Tax=Sinanodonta woodiana TaxID=1069815 RepID=A0ABD3Y1V9_SINWO